MGVSRRPVALGAAPGVTFGVALVALLCFPTPLGASRPLHSGSATGAAGRGDGGRRKIPIAGC